MIVRLQLHFDEQEYKDNYPDLTDEQIITMFKEDFVDTIHKQWTWQDIYDSLEVSHY